MGRSSGARIILGAACAAVLAAGLTPIPSCALSLEEAIAQALSGNELARSADERARAAEARVGAARGFLLPDLTATSDYTRRSHETRRTDAEGTTTLQSRDATESRLTLEQTIFDAQAWPLLRQARRARDAARYAALDAKRQLAFETAQAFLAALNTEKIARAAAERLDLAQRNHDEVRVRFDAQLVGSNDLTRAELEAASAERELVSARGSARTARLDLELLLGAPVADSLAVPRTLLELAAEPIPSGPDGSQDAADRRMDVRAERARTAALRAGAAEPLMRYLPDLGFTGTAWRTNETGFSGRDEDWTIGLGLDWEIFDGGVREATRSERAAEARAAALDLSYLERRVALDIATARVNLESQQASLARSEVAVDAARRNAGETAELYRRGLVRALEVVDANVQLFEAEVEQAGAQFALAIAFLDLRAALGLEPLASGEGP